MFEHIFEILKSLGLPGVFFGVFFEAIGLPFPGSVLVALAGFWARQGEFNVVTAWLVSLAGYLLGSLSAFMIGRYIGEPFIKRCGRYIRLTPQRIRKAQKLLQKSAPIYIIGGRFIPTVGNITPYVAGIGDISIVKFLIYDMVHAVLWLSIFMGLGAVFGGEWHKMLNSLWIKVIAVGVGLLVLVYVFRDYYKTKN